MAFGPAAIASGVSGGVVAAVGGLLAYATRNAGSQLFGATLVAPATADCIALTFDDGPNPTATPRLLEVLARHQVRATFFVIGDFARREPALVREIAAGGHVVGNHTMSHLFLPRFSEARIRAEIARCSAVIEDTLGQAVTLFRPPYGARRPAVLRIARELGLTTVQWNVIVQDWRPAAAATLAARMEKGLRRHQASARGTCLVLHDGGQDGLGQPRLATVEAVDQFLGVHAEDGLKFVAPPDWI